MSWYYAENNERRGPVEEAAFQALVTAGTITPDTLVWREGFANWIPYSQAVSAAAGGGVFQSGGRRWAASGAVACSQCNRLFAEDETVTYEGRHICAECKPLFFQKIKEGVSVTGERSYAGFWIRFAAKFVDGIILNIVSRLIGLVVGMSANGSQSAVMLAALVAVVINAGYVIYFTGKYGQTPGKMACKIEVIRADGEPMTFGRATGRYFAEILSSLTLFIGYIMVAFDEEKRALHDRICDTRVVRKQ